MSVNFVNGDIFARRDIGKTVFICHQCNCRGRMGAGIAGKIREMYPEVYDLYVKELQNHLATLGDIIAVKVNDNVRNITYVVNILGQMDYGNDGQCYTDYDAVRSALIKLRENFLIHHDPKNVVVRIPAGMGSGLAGGNKSTMMEIILRVYGKSPYQVQIVNFDENKI